MDRSALDTSSRALLLFSQHLDSHAALVARLRQGGWEVLGFGDLAALDRHLHHRPDACAAGLLDLRGIDAPTQLAALASVLGCRQRAWVAVIDPDRMHDADVRHLVRDRCFDFITLPCPDADLDAVIDRAYGMACLGRNDAPGRDAPMTLEQARSLAERDAIIAALHRNRRRIGDSARELGISRVTLYRLMTRLGLRMAVAAD